MSASKRAAESVADASADETLWPEWTDASLNKENWATPKNGPDGLFRDTQLVQLPPSLEPSEWIRAKDLPNLSEPLTLYVTAIEHPDFVASNKHLLHSEVIDILQNSRSVTLPRRPPTLHFARWFISALINLQYCGRDGLEISGETGNFIWNGRDQPWQGWTNVYSMNKAGKGVQHRPAVNPNGKYIVRVYFLGSWRRILVDDMIPVNAEMLPLLPRTSYDFELWPMLLAKSLLKLASLTWSGCREIVDFHPVTCLTGWVCLLLNIGYMSPQDKWDFLRKYADHFEWQAEVGRQSQEGSRSRKDKEAKASKETVRTKKSKDTDRTDATKKTKDDIPKLKALVKPQPVTLFLGLEDMKGVSSEDVPDLAPCWSHFIHVAQSRDIPLDPKDVKPPLARWKLYRWLKWAIHEGIIDPVEYFMPIRSLKVVSPLKRCEESVINKYSAANGEENTRNVNVDSKTKVDQTDTKYRPREKSKDRQKATVTEKISEDVSFWADFNKMEPFVRDVQFFYKLDYFPYTVKLSDRFLSKQQNDQKSDTKKGSKKGSRKSSPSRTTFKDPEFVDTYGWPQKLSKTRNEPLYIFTDSLEQKFFLINFSTFQVSVDTDKTNKSETSNSWITLKGNDDCLSLERHNWFRRPEKSYCLVSILTAGTKSNVLEIDRGRHLLRVYCHSESNCFATISSDTSFHVGDRRRMYQLMCTESETIDYMSRYISNSISNAYQAFGTERFSGALSIYYKSYLPPGAELTEDNKQLYNQIHDYFIEEEVQLLRKLMPENDIPAALRSLRIFFLNHTIGLECFNATSMFLKSLRESNISKTTREIRRHDSSQQSSKSNLLSVGQAAVIIQSFFKMITIRKYKNIHDSIHEQHHKVSDNLLKIAELFNYNKRESLANQLLRNILKHHDKLYDIYSCSKDFEHTLQAQELKGTLSNVRPNQWLPIVRLVVNPQVTETVLASVDLFVGLPKYSVRVFCNETCKEMFRLINNVAPTRYPHAKLGYTIFCYGWSEDQTIKELPYALNIVTMKGEPMFHFLENETSLPAILMPPLLIIQELSNSYIPNSGNFISKWIVRVTKSCVASFRLRTSYEKVRMKFSVIDDEHHVLAQIKGTSVVILPMVYLAFTKKPDEPPAPRARNSADGDNNNNNNNGEEDSGEEKVDADGDRSNEDLEDRVIYHVEASILDDSWPLTRAEWSLVSEFQVKPTGSLIKTKLPLSWSATKLSKTDSSKSRTESLRSKKGSKQSVDSGPGLESPYWILQVVTDAEDGLEIVQDRSKEMEIARMKEIWAEENPDSLQRGRELREAFIKKHEIQSKSSTTCSLEGKPSSLSVRSSSRRLSRRSSTADVSSDISTVEERTLKAPPSLRRLPPLDLSVHQEQDDLNDEPYVRTDSAAEMLADIQIMRIVQAQESYSCFLKELQGLMRKHRERYETLYGDYQDNFWDRRADLEEAYEARNAYVNSMKAVAASSTKSTVNKKSKASKKN